MASNRDIIVYDPSSKESAIGGAIEGAEHTKRETMAWEPSRLSPDAAINGVKMEADARTRDMAVNDGYSQGMVRLQKNSIVGASFRLNSKPDYRTIYGADTAAAAAYGEELASVAEARFNLAADSEDCWFDAAGMLTFTGMIRMGIGSCVMTGEYLATSEYQTSDPLRPFKTMFQMISPDRLSNRDGMPDTRNLRRGVEMDNRGKPTFFHIRRGHPTDFYDLNSDSWMRIPARKPWGRRQVIFIREAQQIDQTRGLSEMVAALSHARMTKKFSEITLQRAVVDATYSAAIESELPNSEVVAALGGGQDGWQNAIGIYMSMMQQYFGASENIAIDGVKMPQMFPGSSMKINPVSAPQGVGQEFEASLLRKIAATLGVSYADLSRDFSTSTYSGLKGELALAERDIAAKKKSWADRIANQMYQNWFEEEMGAGNLPLPPGRNRTDFYRPLMKDAYTRAAWIGTGRGQIDELKETQAAMLRVKAGFSTFEKEAARMGEDYREIFAQRAKEDALQRSLGLQFTLDASRDGNNAAGDTITQDDPNTTQDAQDNADIQTQQGAQGQ